MAAAPAAAVPASFVGVYQEPRPDFSDKCLADGLHLLVVKPKEIETPGRQFSVVAVAPAGAGGIKVSTTDEDDYDVTFTLVRNDPLKITWSITRDDGSTSFSVYVACTR